MAFACAVEPAALRVPDAQSALPAPLFDALFDEPPPPFDEVLFVVPPLELQEVIVTDPAAIRAAIEKRRSRLTTSPSLTGVDFRCRDRTLGADSCLLLADG